MKIQSSHIHEDIVYLDNLLEGWKEFVKGKRDKLDVQEFSIDLMDNIFSLYSDLLNLTYNHGNYQEFNICVPKPRIIHKAMVRDRLLHRALYRKLYPFFDRTFIYDSYSCRLNKGTHRAINRFRDFFYKISKNNTRSCWVLKCDIQKFFASINHQILKKILGQYIPGKKILWLLAEVIDSFEIKKNKGLPLGNLTSQLLVNIYMNEFDQFVKHKIKAKYYIRYADDFVLMSENHDWLENKILAIDYFLRKELDLKLHPDKIIIQTVCSGVDYLGWISFADHRIVRTSTKRRLLNKLSQDPNKKSLNSYLGLLQHGNTCKIVAKILEFSGQ